MPEKSRSKSRATGRGTKYEHLLDDDGVRRWYRNVARGSNITAYVYPRRLRNFGNETGLSPVDIVNERITAYADRGTSAELSRFIEKQRRMHLPGVLEYGNSLNQTRIPDISSDKINSKILSCRFEKVLKKHAAVCDESLRMVAAKKDDANALHRLRKNIRELRYTLELFPENKKIAPTLKTLAEWQQVLGSIRDIDIALFFLKKRKMTSRANDIRKKALRDRSLNYAAFLKLASDDGILDDFRSLKIEPH